ncbi:agglutinin biogenesis protein MshJ [Pseudoalteromonas ruthenica]|uniref:agglutinin biogenesis protein MshJ n=1 Tax=Pseudoalteromonas ruthenica TaxID=151081 RepID=UPI0012451898|nr:agglutinin biogenesis protein MshJ [Pseudoalteromonas ruthenica]|tara:strand:- start:77716 stop:78372 length:657 start_codon:yes stop_codon:yes gene_type:complete
MKRWQHISNQFSQLQQREKMLVLTVGLFCILYLGGWFISMPLMENHDQAATQIAGYQSENASLRTQRQALTQALAIDYKANLKLQLQELHQRNRDLDQQLQQLSDGFVSGDRMPDVLGDLLAQQQGVQLLGFKVMGVEAVQTGEQSEPSSPQLQFYQHNMQMTLQGNYFALRDYMARIEQAATRVLITGFHYQVQEHPRAQLTLNLATVSNNETFISL